MSDFQVHRCKYRGPHGRQCFLRYRVVQVADNRTHERLHSVPIDGIVCPVGTRVISHWEDYSGEVESTIEKQFGKANRN